MRACTEAIGQNECRFAARAHERGDLLCRTAGEVGCFERRQSAPKVKLDFPLRQSLCTNAVNRTDTCKLWLDDDIVCVEHNRRSVVAGCLNNLGNAPVPCGSPKDEQIAGGDLGSTADGAG